ncbi:MAG: leucine-rich repeat protein, partial [Clostridia bacterium]|nr:leucine-rich repeat protein [Clostridia bacterium]
ITKIYGSENFTNELTVKKEGLNIAYSSSDTSVANVNSTTGEVTIVGVGSAVITAEDSTENQLASYTLEVTLDGMEYAVTGFHDEYDGNPHSISINVTKPAEGAVIMYGTEEGTYDLEESPSLTNAGSLTVYYEITNSNYETVTGSEIIVVEKAVGVIGYETIQLTKTPADETFTNELTKVGDGTVTYTSSNTSAATVNSGTGEVTIAGVGTTIITATVQDSANYEYTENEASYTVVVNRREGVITYNVTEMTKVVGDESFTNPITTNGDGTVTYLSSDESIASVNSTTGEVTITGYGTVTVTASITDTEEYDYEPNSVSYTLTIERVAASMSYSEASINKHIGDVNFTNELTNLGNGTVTYASDNTSVATVNSSTGEVTIVAAGSATITATTEDTATYTYETKTASYTLNVSKRAGSISFESNSVDKYADDGSFTNTLTNTGDGTVTYESLNTTVATINSTTGLVTINALGNATIRATVEDSNAYTYETKTISYTLMVSKHNGSISYAITSVDKTTVDTAFTNTLTKTGNGLVTYESNNTSVATVNSLTGSITINGVGSATITATVTDSSEYIYEIKTATYTIIVETFYGLKNGNTYTSWNDLISVGIITINNGIVAVPSDKRSSLVGELIIPNSVTSIDDEGFYCCSSLTSIILPNSLTSIGELAFGICSGLQSLLIPSCVNNIENGALSYCSNLKEITVSDSNNYYSSSDGVLYDKNKTILISYPIGKTETSFTVPNTVTSIASNAFINSSNLITINLSSNLTSIGDNAFYWCTKIENISFPNALKSIGERSFFYCRNLTSITIPVNVSSIGSEAFSNCYKLASITVASKNTTYNSGNGNNCIIKTSSKELIFGCKNTTIPNTVTSIGSRAFYGSGIESITIPSSVTNISSQAFLSCASLTKVTIPSSVTNIESEAFWQCSSLTNVSLASGVKTIGTGAFRECYSLTSITIPNSVTTMSGGVFDTCTNLTSVTLSNKITLISDSTFFGCRKLSEITIPSSVTFISSDAFAYCDALTSIIIPSSVNNIWSTSFRSCTNLTSITVKKAKGSIVGSPWGATKATVTWSP